VTVAQKAPCRLGTHRVIEPEGALPQAAWRLDATPRAQANEILCDVETLNIDSASFRQIASANDNDPARIAEHIVATVRERGKQHNPVTGSGGMFVGRVAAIGEALRDRVDLREGDAIASLVSLTLTPLSIEAVERVDVATGRVWLRGSAILFESALYAKLPDDIPRDVALAVLDVAGAPAQVARLAQPGQTVVIIGADGKSGLLASAQAKRKVGATGRVIGIGPDPQTAGARLLLESGIADAYLAVDATRTLDVVDAIATQPNLADLVVNCVNVPGTELSSILCARDEGTVYFFSMNTSFSAAALGAEGIGKDVTMVIGNGYTKGHADLALQTLRDHPPLLRYFTDRYSGPQSS
jgi:L-erythro-3,5-diaminohexanoate dehydrogenase